jgi:Flp pilus assembly pilin Flp
MRARARGQSLVEYGLLVATVALTVLMFGGGWFGMLLRLWFDAMAATIVRTGT